MTRGPNSPRRVHRPCVACVLGLLLSSSPLWAISLDEAVSLGLALHPQVAAARAQLQTAETEVAIARDGYWPTVQASAGPENSLWGDLGYDITASQMLYDWGRVASSVDAASARERQQLEELKIATDEAALDIIEVYLDVLLFEGNLQAAERHIQRLESLAVLSRDRSSQGYSDRSETERVELELARAREQRTIEQGALFEARAVFRELVHRPPEHLSLPSPDRFTDRLSDAATLEGLIAEAPRYRHALEDIEAALAEREESRTSLKPKLSVEASLLRREIGGRLVDDSVIALRLRMDTFQGLSSFRRVEAANSRIDTARWNQRTIRRDLRREFTRLMELDAVLIWRLEALQVQLRSAEQVASAYREQFSAGMRSIDDLLPVQREHFDVERQANELQSQQLRIQYRVTAQLGRLGELLSLPRDNDQQGAS